MALGAECGPGGPVHDAVWLKAGPALRVFYGGGAGLGLAIAKEIVSLHGGTITAASENEVIAFTITLPYR